MEFETALQVGMKEEVTELVTTENTAVRMGSGSLPVYATPAMSCRMEQAAAVLAERYMPDGWTTVGISLQLAHKAATPVGLMVHAVAEVVAVEGRKITYKVTAWDDREEIGSGLHERFAVQKEKFMGKAQAKK